jgi:hypothetical protein
VHSFLTQPGDVVLADVDDEKNVFDASQAWRWP